MCISCNENINPIPPANPCGDKISSDEVVYVGPNLTCTGIETCDTLTMAIKKISDYMCSLELVQNIITNIYNNTEIRIQFINIVNANISCETVQTCITSTTAVPECSCYKAEITLAPGTIAITDNGEVAISWFDCEDNPNFEVVVTNGVKPLGCVNFISGIIVTGIIEGVETNISFDTTIISSCCP